MPEYPATANGGILHFIHLKNPIESQSRDPQDISEEEVHKAFTKTMSKVIIFWGIYKSMLRPYRYNSPCIIGGDLMSPDLNCSPRKTTMMLARHGIEGINAVGLLIVNMPMTV